VRLAAVGAVAEVADDRPSRANMLSQRRRVLQRPRQNHKTRRILASQPRTSARGSKVPDQGQPRGSSIATLSPIRTPLSEVEQEAYDAEAFGNSSARPRRPVSLVATAVGQGYDGPTHGEPRHGRQGQKRRSPRNSLKVVSPSPRPSSSRTGLTVYVAGRPIACLRCESTCREGRLAVRKQARRSGRWPHPC